MSRNTRDRELRRSRRGVSRRRFVQTVGIGSAGLGIAGTGSVLGDLQEDAVVLQWAASEEEAGEIDAINEAFHDAGVSENIEIEVLPGGDVTDDRRQQYQQWLAAGRTQPDLLRMDTGWTVPFIARDQLVNLSQELDDDTVSRVEEDYFDMTLESVSGPDGNLFGVPLWAGLPTMQYRKDLVEEAGYDPEGNNWATESMHWQEFSEMVADVRDEHGLEHGFTFQADVYEGLSCCNFNEFMTSWGGAYFGGDEYLFGPVGDRPVTVGEEPTQESMRMIRSFLYGDDEEDTLNGYEQISPEAVLNWTEPETARPFQDGDAVANRNWPFFVGQHGDEEMFGEDLGVMPIPYGVEEEEAEYPGTGGPVAALGGWNLAVNPNTEHMDEALEVVEAATTDEFNLDIFEILGQIPPKPHVLEEDRAQDVPVMGRYLDTFRVAGENAMPRPVTVVWPDQSTQIAQLVNAGFDGTLPVEEAASDLQAVIEDIEGMS